MLFILTFVKLASNILLHGDEHTAVVISYIFTTLLGIQRHKCEKATEIQKKIKTVNVVHY